MGTGGAPLEVRKKVIGATCGPEAIAEGRSKDLSSGPGSYQGGRRIGLPFFPTFGLLESSLCRPGSNEGGVRCARQG